MPTIKLLTKVLQYSNTIKEKLNISEKEFFESKFEDTEKAFYFWIYSIIDDIYKISMKIISEQELIESKNDKYLQKNEDNIKGLDFERYLFENISIELDFWTRKSVEHFLNLILLKNEVKKDDLENVSKIYFLSLRIKDTMTSHKIFKDYYDFNNTSLEIEKEILLEKNLNLIGNYGKIPYFLENLDFKSVSKIFKSSAKLYKQSLRFCSDNEKMILGLNYSLYHNLSKGIHGNGHYRKENINLDYCIQKYNQIILSIFTILGVIYDLLNIEKDEFLTNLNFLDDKLKANFTKKYNKGNLVMFLGDLYEIKDFKKSNYGYFSYLIFRELGTGKNEKWVPQEGLFLALNENNLDNIFKQIENTFKKDNLILFKSLTKKEQFIGLKTTILDLNKNGINIFAK